MYLIFESDIHVFIVKVTLKITMSLIKQSKILYIVICNSKNKHNFDTLPWGHNSNLKVISVQTTLGAN
jgi:hypothetical protein